MTDEAQRIADGLSEAMQADLTDGKCVYYSGGCLCQSDFVHDFVALGIADETAQGGRPVTPLGLAVREILIRESQS